MDLKDYCVSVTFSKNKNMTHTQSRMNICPKDMKLCLTHAWNCKASSKSTLINDVFVVDLKSYSVMFAELK